MARSKRSVRLQRRLARLRQVTFVGAIGLGGLMWAYAMMQSAGIQISARDWGVSHLISLVDHRT